MRNVYTHFLIKISDMVRTADYTFKAYHKQVELQNGLPDAEKHEKADINIISSHSSAGSM